VIDAPYINRRVISNNFNGHTVVVEGINSKIDSVVIAIVIIRCVKAKLEIMRGIPQMALIPITPSAIASTRADYEGIRGSTCLGEG
jgi:hypothetical protein